jgi:benzoate 4-monooxygenase
MLSTMALLNPVFFIFLAPVWLILYYLVPFFTTYKHLRNIPGPFIAKFSNTLLALAARQGKKFAWVDWAHRKYGPVVRIGFNHVSIAKPEALQVVYAHGNGFLKE